MQGIVTCRKRWNEFRAVDQRSFVIGTGNVLEPGEENDDQISREPHSDQGERGNDELSIGDEFQFLDADQRKEIIEKAEICLVEPGPADIYGHGGQDVGQIKHRAK